MRRERAPAGHLQQPQLPTQWTFAVALYAAIFLPPISGAKPNSPSPRPSAPVGAQEVLEAAATSPRPALDRILDALRAVETGGSADQGRHAVGDGGKAIGPLQIHRAYWRDAGVPGRYADCRDPQYARAVVLAYWRRYCPAALESLDAEVLARVHNGGPGGHRRKCTRAFWRKVERELARLDRRAARGV